MLESATLLIGIAVVILILTSFLCFSHFLKKRKLVKNKTDGYPLREEIFHDWIALASFFVASLLMIASILLANYTSLTGQISTYSWYEKENGVVKTEGDRIDFIAAIQNPSNNPVSLKAVILEFDNGVEVNLFRNIGHEGVSEADTRFTTKMSQYGTPIGVGEAVRIELSMSDEDKRAIEGAAFKSCYAVSTLDQRFPLDINQPVSIASDRIINSLSIDTSTLPSENSEQVESK